MSEDQKTPEAQPKVSKPKLRINLAGAIAIAIVAACCIVAVAYTMYWNDSNRKYDIARGGEKENKALTIEDQEADTTSPVTPSAVKKKLDYLTKELNALNSLNKFNAEDLSDQSIQLLPSEESRL